MPLATLWSHMTGGRTNTRDPRHQRAVVFWDGYGVCEPLERRALLSDFNLGVLEGRAYLDGETVSAGDPRRWIFTLARPSTVQALQSRIDILSDRPEVTLGAERAAPPTDFPLPTYLFLNRLEPVELPAGTFSILVDTINERGSYDYTLAIDVDAAGAAFLQLDEGELIFGNRGHDFGELKDSAGANSINDFIGYLDGSDRRVADQDDLYFFDVPIGGPVTIELTQTGGPDPNGGEHRAFAVLFRDEDGDGDFDPSEDLSDTGLEFFQFIDSPDDSITMSASLTAGRYAFKLSAMEPGLLTEGGFNYHLDIDYARPDGAGNTLAGAADLGTQTVPVGQERIVAVLPGHLSADNPTDVYRFVTPATGGPFHVLADLLVEEEGSDFSLELIRDDGDRVVEAGEVLDFSDIEGAGFLERVSGNNILGTYFVRVSRISGEGPYELRLNFTDRDQGGSTFATAGALGTLSGMQFFQDTLSASDTLDFYRFTLVNQAQVELTLGPGSGNADLFLVREQNGTVEVIDSSQTSGIEFLRRGLSGGTHYLMISRVSGTPDYTLQVHADYAGQGISTGVLLGEGSVADDFVGREDNTDYYRFTIGSPRQVGVFVSGPQDTLEEALADRFEISERIRLAVGQDTNANGLLDSSERLFTRTLTPGDSESRVNLDPGTYAMEIRGDLFQEAHGTNYKLKFGTAPTDLAGNTLAEARDIGTLGNPRSFGDFLGRGAIPETDDLVDFYKFTVGSTGPYDFRGILNVPSSSPQGRASVAVIFDRNANRRIDAGEVMDSVDGTGAGLWNVLAFINRVGDYYVQIQHVENSTNYSLSLRATSVDNIGNGLSTAPDLGHLTSTLGVNGFVGSIDVNDFYRFSVDAPSELAIAATGTLTGISIQVIRDANGNLQIDSGDVLATGFAVTPTDFLMNGAFLSAGGTYFFRVHATGGDSSYNLTLTRSAQTPLTTPFQVSFAGATRIEAENFDRGGQQVAYVDTTRGNSGGAFRTGEDVDIQTTTDKAATSGGFRVTDMAAGEFMEYTINVLDGGNYDFDFRVASPAAGAAFHLEVDGVRVTSRIDIPKTGGSDMMTTVTRTGILLTPGPHILRLVSLLSVRTESFNFITIRPASLSTGTFELTPPDSHVGPDGRAILSLSWTVPQGGWRTLREVQLRLIDVRGTALWVKFDEAANTLSLFNLASGRFGPARKLGSNGVLANGDVTVHLRTSRIVAAGPAAPRVSLELDVSFKQPAFGRSFLVEAAASDDLGHEQDFAFAGTIEV